MKQCPLIALAKLLGRLKHAGRHCRLCCSAVQGAAFQGANLLVGAVNCGSWRCKLRQLAL